MFTRHPREWTCTLNWPRGPLGTMGHSPRNARKCSGFQGGLLPPHPRFRASSTSLCSLQGLCVLGQARSWGRAPGEKLSPPPGGMGSAGAPSAARHAQRRRSILEAHPSFLRKTCGLIRPPVSGFQNHPGTRTPRGGGQSPRQPAAAGVGLVPGTVQASGRSWLPALGAGSPGGTGGRPQGSSPGLGQGPRPSVARQPGLPLTLPEPVGGRPGPEGTPCSSPGKPLSSDMTVPQVCGPSWWRPRTT